MVVNFHTKFYSSRCTQCIHVGSYKLKIPKDIHASEVQTAHSVYEYFVVCQS